MCVTSSHYCGRFYPFYVFGSQTNEEVQIVWVPLHAAGMIERRLINMYCQRDIIDSP